MRVLITHNDLDGIGAEVIARAFNVVDVVYQEDYATVDKKILEVLASPLDKLYIVDISPQRCDVIDLLDKCGKVQLYDHHQTALDTIGQRDWAYFDMKRCGTKIFAEEEGLTKGYEDFIYHVNDYDLWHHESEFSKDLNMLVWVLKPDNFIERFVSNPSVELTDEEEVTLALYKHQRAEFVDGIIDKAIAVEDKIGRRVVVALSSRYTSQVAETIMDRYETDYVVVIDLDRNKASLRSRDVDVREIAEVYGGGGHKLAAGFEMPGHELVNRFIRRPRRVMLVPKNM